MSVKNKILAKKSNKFKQSASTPEKSKFGKKVSKKFAIKKSRKKHEVKNQPDEETVTDSDEDMSVDSSDDSEEDYEKVPRVKKSVQVRNLLPVKTKKGLVYRSQVLKEANEEEAPEAPVEQAENERKDLVHSFAMQQKCFKDLKCKVALLCTSIIEEPEHNMVALKELLSMLQNPTTPMIVSEKKILSISLLHVFLDVIPGYRIRNKEEQDPYVKLKKETKKLLAYEQTLLKCYKRYLELMYDIIRDMKHKMSQKNISSTKQRASYEMGVVAVKCMCDLLSTRSHFNFFKNIANKLVPLAIDGDEKVSEMCCVAFERLFEADKRGEASYNLVKQIADVIKLREFVAPVNLLRVFLKLNLREAKPEVQKIDMRKGRAQWRAMSRTQRRSKKRIKKLEAELLEAQAYENVENVKKFHTDTLNKIFWVYFHVLKDGKQLSLIGPAFEGLSNFAYLINLEFFDDLNAVMCSLMETGKLSEVDKLHGVYTLFTILAGQAESLHVDPHQMYCHMYQALLNLSYSTDIKHFELTLKCLEFNVLRKSKKISFGRILAFMKRIGTTSLHTPLHATLGLLSSLRKLVKSVQGADILLDSESCFGSGLFFPDIGDPEHCNAQSTALWELYLLKKHYNPAVKLYALHILQNCPIIGRSSLPDKLATLTPEETLQLFSDIAINNKIDFLEDNEEPPKKKFKSGYNSMQTCYENNTDLELDWEMLNNIDFFTSC
ncbi:nucleolar complex protein 3 homolog [Nephila pilipes]|uniref:NOC3-like protein n=1 Tax=Nephila pilipes TaxID=299642 RepID=A0A8X6Q336_NEPPI|nr:nucleolar complex protein 3 homolog [Nephila pilipes]